MFGKPVASDFYKCELLDKAPGLRRYELEQWGSGADKVIVNFDIAFQRARCTACDDTHCVHANVVQDLQEG